MPPHKASCSAHTDGGVMTMSKQEKDRTPVLRLEPEKTVCHPGEMVYFRMRYTDGSGEVKPTEKHRITVSAENGTVMGTANGSTYFQGNYARNDVPTYFGEAQTVVQAAAAGTMLVTVTDGIRTAAAEIICRET